jgi:hypothetical protein
VLAAEGLAFAFVVKGGVGVAFLSGSGFVIRKARPNVTSLHGLSYLPSPSQASACEHTFPAHGHGGEVLPLTCSIKH